MRLESEADATQRRIGSIRKPLKMDMFKIENEVAESSGQGGKPKQLL